MVLNEKNKNKNNVLNEINVYQKNVKIIIVDKLIK